MAMDRGSHRYARDHHEANRYRRPSAGRQRRLAACDRYRLLRRARRKTRNDHRAVHAHGRVGRRNYAGKKSEPESRTEAATRDARAANSDAGQSRTSFAGTTAHSMTPMKSRGFTLVEV